MNPILAIVEIPFGSTYKYEKDEDGPGLTIDRPLYAPIPYNYGYFEHTLGQDGDPLDVVILGKSPIYPLSRVKVVILGAYRCIDNGEGDDKIVARVNGESLTIDEETAWDEVKHYLQTYKAGFQVIERVDAKEAYKIYCESKIGTE